MSKFWYGYCTAVLYNQMTQDLMGKERYLKVVDIFWMDTKWWYWLTLWIVLSGVIVFTDKEKT